VVNTNVAAYEAIADAAAILYYKPWQRWWTSCTNPTDDSTAKL